MILKKIVKDNQTVYVEIDKAEAKEAAKRGEEVLFTDDDEIEEEIEEEIEKAEEKEEDEREDHEKTHGFEHARQAAESARRMGERIRRNMDRHFGHMHYAFHGKDEDFDPRTGHLLRLLPFMDEEDIHEIVTKYLDGDPDYAKLKLPAIMPFLSDEDCDAVFKKALENKELGHYFAAIVPFVSQTALSALVDQYLEGKYPDLNIDQLYPFLDPKDIKRVLHHWMKK